MFKHIDLCSGIGGFALGFEWASLSSPVMFCDIEPWSRKVLAKHWPDVQIAEDVKELANEPTKIPAGGRDTILTAGYPCQSFSQAGKRRGEEDDRYIWPYIREIVAQKRPAWCVFENVYGHVSMGLDTVLSNLEADGYATRPFIVPACGVDAPHRRDRVWIIGRNVANTDSIATGQSCDGFGEERVNGGAQRQRPIERHRFADTGQDVANTYDPRDRTQRHDTDAKWAAAVERRQEQSQYQFSRQRQDVAYSDSERGRLRHTEWQDAEDARQSSRCQKHGGWDFEPSVGRVAHGVPGRVDRLKGLGNAIVPQIAMRIGLIIKEASNV